jgi:outer membrane protein assembly factor BamB
MKVISWKMLPARLSQLICAMLLILPVVSSGNEVLLQKSSELAKEPYRISYSLELKKQNMQTFRGNPTIRDRFSNKTQLDLLNYTPSAYYIGSQRWSGYPLPGEYPSVTQLEWELQASQRFRYPQDHFSASHDAGINFRDDLLHFPETTVAWEKDYSYGALPPLVDLVKGRQWVFAASMDGRLSAFHSNTGRTQWEFKFPLGESIQNAMASFVHQDRLLLSAGTNLGNIYFFLAETGALFYKISLGSPLNAPLHYFKSEEMTGLIAVSKRELVCIDIEAGKEKWRKTISEEISLSPFSLQVGRQMLIIVGSISGNIHALSLEGNSIWQKSSDSSNLSCLVGFVSQAKPYIAGATMSKSVFLLNAANGQLLSRKKIPALPRSVLSVDARSFSFGIVVADPENTDKSYMLSDHFFSDQRIVGQVSLPGRRFLGPIGTRIDGETFYYLIDEQWGLWMIQKDSSRAVRGFPFRLSLYPGAYYPHQSGGMVLTDYALFAACPGKGLIAVGSPETFSMDRSFRELSSYQQTQSNYRNDIDRLPSAESIRLYPVSLSVPDKQRVLPKPGVLFFPKSRELFMITSTAEGDIVLYDEQGKQRYRLNLQAGRMNANPILEFIREDEVRIFLLSEKVLQSWAWNIHTQRLVRLWERRDLNSKASTFIQAEHDSGKTLYFVDERNYLTAVASDSGDTIFREIVDSHQFVYYVIYAQAYVFCGSKKIDARTGKLISRSFTPASHSSVVSLAGKSYLFQSDDLDMIAWDAHKQEQLWRVRRLWCKQYCFQRTAPAILHKAYGAWAYWTDYTRLVCIDVVTGFISWRASFRDDYMLSSPAIAENAGNVGVFLGSIRGNLYAFHARSGETLNGFPLQLPGKENPDETLKGCSIPLVLNGSLLIYRMETGLIQLGKITENNRDFNLIQFQVSDEHYKLSRPIFNRAEVFWDQKAYFSNIVQD